VIAVLLKTLQLDWPEIHSHSQKHAMAVPLPGGEGKDEGDPKKAT